MVSNPCARLAYVIDETHGRTTRPAGPTWMMVGTLRSSLDATVLLLVGILRLVGPGPGGVRLVPGRHPRHSMQMPMVVVLGARL